MLTTDSFRAFISYSHEDRAAAQRIHKALETYRMPGRLVGLTTAKGVVPKRVGRIFRDREDLPASGDLSAAVRDALGRSETLIVLCSPAAARSVWVDTEIKLFRELHPDRDILIAILEGEPDPAADESCFPPSLRDAILTGEMPEPIAADYRPGMDGKPLATLKLIAGLFGLPLDQIIQRDAQRRQRRVTAITVFLLLLALIMTGLAGIALQARSEADRRRAEAEDLVEFMLTDLRAKLEPVGRLDVLDAVGEKVVEYYQEQPVHQLTADERGRRSRAYQLLGEINVATGDMEAAYPLFVEAYENTEGLLAAAPDDTARLYEHAQSAFWVGLSAWRRADLEAAETYFQEYAALSTRMVELVPGDQTALTEAAFAHSNLGTLYIDRGDLDAAHNEVMASLDLFLQLAEDSGGDPAAWTELAGSWGWLSYIEERRNAREAAIAALQQQLAIYDDQLSASADGWSQRYDSLVAETSIANLYLYAHGDTAADEQALGLGMLEAASAEAAALIAHDPSNAVWRRLAVRQLLMISRGALELGQIDTARQAYGRAQQMMTHESWQGLDDQRYAASIMRAALIEARLFAALGRNEEARQAVEDLLTDLGNENYQLDWASRTALYLSAVILSAELLEADGARDEARQAREAAIERIDDAAMPLNVASAYEFRKLRAAQRADLILAE